METNRKKKKKDLALFMVYLIKKGFYSSRSQGPNHARTFRLNSCLTLSTNSESLSRSLRYSLCVFFTAGSGGVTGYDN